MALASTLPRLPINCPFMADNYSSPILGNQLRVNAHHGGNKQYTPDSFSNMSRPDTAEAPYAVSIYVILGKLYYAQAVGYASKHCEDGCHVKESIIQKQYMAHNYNIAPEYPEIIHDIIPDKHFEFSEVEEMSKEAHKFHQESKFARGENDRLAWYAQYVGLIDVLEVVAHGRVPTAFGLRPT